MQAAFLRPSKVNNKPITIRGSSYRGYGSSGLQLGFRALTQTFKSIILTIKMCDKFGNI